MTTDVKTIYPTGLPIVYAEGNPVGREVIVYNLNSGDEGFRVYQPGGDPAGGLKDGMVFLVGPHWPERHTWQVVCRIKDQFVVEIMSDRPWVPGEISHESQRLAHVHNIRHACFSDWSRELRIARWLFSDGSKPSFSCWRSLLILEFFRNIAENFKLPLSRSRSYVLDMIKKLAVRSEDERMAGIVSRLCWSLFYYECKRTA